MSNEPPAPTPSKGRVFFARLSSTLLLWAVLISAFYSNNVKLVTLVIGVFAILTTLEYYRLLRRDAVDRGFHGLGLAIALAYWAVVGWWVVKHQDQPPLWLDLAALILSVQGSFLVCYRNKLEGMQTLMRIFSTVFGVIYTVIFFGFVVRVMYAPGAAEPNVYMVLYVVMVTKFCDMGAYLVGVLFGKHKMIPHISPAKSWEGFVGAFIGGLLGAALLIFFLPAQMMPLDWMHGLLIAPILCAAGIAGDLAESVLKRCTAIKDSGHTLPGIGGILDLTDSVLFTAPIFYFYLTIIAR
jgi:phosphatidate cytidylyltransferase